MSVIHATSVVFDTSCKFCAAVRRQVATTLKSIYEGIVLGQQLRTNYRIAEQLAGKGDYTDMTVAEVASLINESTM